MASRIEFPSKIIGFPKQKAKKSAPYLNYIRQLPCCVTGVMGVEAAHVSYASPWHCAYGRGRGTKVADRWAVPLSSYEHRQQHGMNEHDYWASKQICPHELALTIHGIWTELDEYQAIQFASARIMQGINNR